MSTDANIFDSWLKKRLYRDLLFRAVLWASISAIALWYALKNSEIDSLGFLERVTTTLMPVINVVGTATLFLAVFAMLLKDLEYLQPDRFGQETLIGRWGGAIRRTSGDLTLWVLGGLVSIAGAFTFAVASSLLNGRFRETETLAVLSSATFLLGMMAIMAILSVLVRRKEPPLASVSQLPLSLRTPGALSAVYGACLFVLAGGLAQ